MFKGKITKIPRPILTLYIDYKGSFSIGEKNDIEKYLRIAISPFQRISEVKAEKDNRGMISFFNLSNNSTICHLYMKEIRMVTNGD